MHIKQMSQFVERFLVDANELQWIKNADYHPDKVAMLEVLQTAWETNITVEQDLWARIRKQMSALRRFVIEGHVESEPPRSRMIDVAVYMGMLAFWMENKNECIRDAAEFILAHRPCERRCNTERLPNQCHADNDPCDNCSFFAWLDEQRTHVA